MADTIWKLVASRPVAYVPLDDWTKGWKLYLKRADGSTDERRLIRVEVQGTTVATYGGPGRESLPAEVKKAITTEGRSAVDAYLTSENPPAKLLISGQGIVPADR